MIGLDLLLSRTKLVGILPHLMPIDGSLRRSTCSNRFENELGRVVPRATTKIRPLVKVIDERRRVLAEIAKVNRLAALLEQQESVKDLEQFTRRLMNRCENGLSMVGQFTEQLSRRWRTRD